MSTKHAVETLKAEVWKTLFLDERSIIFHLIDFASEPISIGSGMVETPDDLYDSDAMAEIFEQYADKEELTVDSVETFMLGDGESDHADWNDVEYLGALAEEHPNTLRALLDEYADLLCTVETVTLDNPWND